MEAITFGSRSIFGEIKTGVIPSLPGERKIVRHAEGQASECVDQQAMPGAVPAMGGFRITQVVNTSYGPTAVTLWWSYHHQHSEWVCFQVRKANWTVNKPFPLDSSRKTKAVGVKKETNINSSLLRLFQRKLAFEGHQAAVPPELVPSEFS